MIKFYKSNKKWKFWIIYNDGVNNSKGIDLTPLDHKKLRGERGGILYDNFCVIDNVSAILGSYNWTNNAEFKKDENNIIKKYDVIFLFEVYA